MFDMGYTSSNLITSGIYTTVLNKAIADFFFVFDNTSTKTFINGYNSAVSVTGLSPEIPTSVISINNGAFLNCLTLNQIIIPSTVTSIGDTAFSGCTALTTVTLQRLQDQTLTTLGSNCFLNVGFTTTNYTSVINMYKMKYTRSNLITAGISLNVVDVFFVFNANKTSITGFNTVVNVSGINLEFPNTVITIGNNAFLNCSTLNQITIPSSVTSIGTSAFKGSSLTSVTIPDSVRSIGDYAYQSCTQLLDVSILNSTIPTTLGISVFFSCSLLKSIYIPDNIKSLGNQLFYNCISLTSVNIPNTVTSIGNEVFRSCSKLDNIVIPNTVTSIGEYVFFNCTSLNNIIISNSVNIINLGMFNGCSSLNQITIPSSVTSIFNNAFTGCNALGQIIIPNSVTSIGISAFQIVLL